MVLVQNNLAGETTDAADVLTFNADGLLVRFQRVGDTAQLERVSRQRPHRVRWSRRPLGALCRIARRATAWPSRNRLKRREALAAVGERRWTCPRGCG